MYALKYKSLLFYTCCRCYTVDFLFFSFEAKFLIHNLCALWCSMNTWGTPIHRRRCQEFCLCFTPWARFRGVAASQWPNMAPILNLNSKYAESVNERCLTSPPSVSRERDSLCSAVIGFQCPFSLRREASTSWKLLDAVEIHGDVTVLRWAWKRGSDLGKILLNLCMIRKPPCRFEQNR